MPAVLLNIPDTHRTITKPVVDSVVQDLRDYLRLDKDLSIKYVSPDSPIPTHGSTVDNKDTTIQLSSKDRLWISHTEVIKEDNLVTKRVHTDDEMPFFLDDKIDLMAKPVYYDCDLTITLTFHTNSKSRSQQWLSHMANKSNVMREVYLHNLNYHYVLPGKFHELSSLVHSLRENVVGYDETLVQYLQKHYTEGLTTTTDVTGSLRTLAMRCTQSRVVGMLNSGKLPERPSYDEGLGMYVCEFEYNLTYNRPHSCYVHYPIMVHNQVLPSDYIQQYSLGELRDHPGVISKAYEGVHQMDMTLDGDVNHNYNGIIHRPVEDEYIPDLKGMRASVVMSLLVTIEDDEPLINLEQMGDVNLDADILHFIKESDYPFIGEIYGSGIAVLLYINEELQPSNTLTVDEDLNVVSNITLSKRDRHRVVIALNTDPLLIYPDFFVRVKKYPKAIVKFLVSVNSGLRYYNPAGQKCSSRFINRGLDNLFRWFVSADSNRAGKRPNGSPFNLSIPEIKSCYVADGRTVQEHFIFTHPLDQQDKSYIFPNFHGEPYVRT